MSDLLCVPPAELTRIRALSVAPERRAAVFAAACRINTLYMITRAGSGHIGTSFSAQDIMAWLFLQELRRPPDSGGACDRFFSSKGHDAPALYSVLIGLGLLPFERLHQLRRLGGLPGHPDVSVPGIEANTGSLGMGISKAKGMALGGRLLEQEGRVFVMTGDGELQEGQIWEALSRAAHLGLGEVTVIADCNRIQSDTWVADTSDLRDVGAKFQAFGWHVDHCDGHDMASLGQALARLRAIPDRPKLLIADTLKGKGVSFMEPSGMNPGAADPAARLYRYHSGAPSDDVYAEAVAELIGTANGLLRTCGAADLQLERVERPVVWAPGAVHRLVGAYGRALVREAERNPRLVALDADLILDCGLIPFRERFPERFIECGIAEQDMVSQAGGLALRGLLPVVHSFACFLSTRPNEQIYNNATERTRIIYVASLAGLLPAGPGHSHQSVRDIAILGSIPGLELIEPSTEAEVELAVDYCVNRAPGSCYLRLVSIPAEVPYRLPDGYRIEPGRGVTLREGRDAVVIAYGPILLSQAYRAAELLTERAALEVAVVNLPWLNRVDLDWLDTLAGRYPWIFSLDNHYVAGGQGQMLAAHLAELVRRPLPRIRRLGVTRVPLCGGNTEVLQAHRLDAESLAEELGAALLGLAVKPRP